MDINALVLDTLQRAISQDTSVLKEAEQKLQEWETQPGFYSLLKDIFCNPSIDVRLRFMALLLIKNGVDKYWRPNAPNALSEEEKHAIRENCISNLHVPEKQLATHLSVLISKIARFDWPGWGSLMPSLWVGVKSDDTVSRRVALLILHQVVKGLASRRLTADRRLFQEFSHQAFPVIFQQSELHAEAFFSKVKEDQDEAFQSLELAYLCLKILDKLMIHGFKRPHESESVNNFLRMLFLRAKNMLAIRQSLKSEVDEVVCKYVVKSTNSLLALLEQHPFSFIDYISTALEFAVYYAFTPHGEQCLFQRFLILCFNLIKSIILCQEFKRSKVTEDPKYPESNRAHQLKEDFFSNNSLVEVCRRLVTHYFLLTREELEKWDTDPEGFATDEGGETWKYSLRPSTETLFATLFHHYHERLTPVLMELVSQHQAPAALFDINAILLKDAVYNAVGIASFDLYNIINFDEWYTATLQGELRMEGDNYRIIRRRIAWLIGIWTGVKMSSELYTSVYGDMLRLLRVEEDMVVRLTAADTVRSVVDDFEFNLDVFLDFLEPMFHSLFTLLKQATESDTKMRVLHVLYFIVERVGLSIEPYFKSLVTYLPLLWQESENHSMLRCAVVATLVHLVRAIGKVNDSEDVSNFILSVISFSVDVRQDSHIYLLEDGLELWYCVLENSPYPSPPIIQLFALMPPLLESNSEYLTLCMNVISAYVLLSPEEILQVYGETLVRIFSDLLTDLRSEGIIIIMRLLDLFLKASPSRSPSLLKPLLPNIFEIICKGEEFTILMSLYLSILSRVLLIAQQTFIETITEVSERIRQSPDEVLNRILDVWLKKMPLVTQAERKKLLALALCSFLVANFKFVFDKFAGIVVAVTEVLNDITRTDETGAHIDALVYTGESDDQSSYDTDHEYRKKQLALSDPVHTTSLQEYFRAQLQALQRDVGPGDFERFVSTLDETMLTQARDFVQL